MWKRFVLTCLLLVAPPCFANTPPKTKALSERLESYLQIMHDSRFLLGPLGSWKQGEIEIILNPEQIKKIENQTRLRLMSKGASEKDAERWASVGIVAEDCYWMWIRDAVIFPSGVYGTYDRLMWKSGMEGYPSVAILPVLSCKKIVVNLTFRHATRSWEIELPRGEKRSDESVEKAATRALREETGYQFCQSSLLGTMASDSGVLASTIPLFFGEVVHSGETEKVFSRAIFQNPALTAQELKDGFARGYIEIPIQGKLHKVNCRDPFLAFAILQAEAKGLLKSSGEKPQ